MSSRGKNGLLVLAILLALLLCYKFSFSNTFSIKDEYKKLSEEQMLYENAPKQLSLLLKKQVYYDSVLHKMNLGNTSIQNSLLRIINVEAEKNKLKVIDFNDPHTALSNGNQLNTFDLTFEGDFTGILKAIYIIEQENNFGEIVHLHFQKNKNYKTNRNYLTTKVFIQNIE